MAVVAIAGPLANLAFAAVLMPLYRFGTMFPADVRAVVLWMIYINILLFSFNLIPIPPLDGFNILTGILPNAWSLILEPIRQYALPILLGAVFLLPYAGNMLHMNLNLLGAAIGPVQLILGRVFLGTPG
jgi:Zn-dependent protease